MLACTAANAMPNGTTDRGREFVPFCNKQSSYQVDESQLVEQP